MELRIGQPGYKWAARQLDAADKALIRGAIEDAKREGADVKALAPFWALVGIVWDEPTPAELARIGGWARKHLGGRCKCHHKA